jgi:hypothetical protein
LNTAVTYLTRSQIPPEQWNAFIDASIQQTIYAQTWYLDVVAPRWGALILSQNTDWQAIMPIPFHKKWGYWVVKQPLFCQFLGVFSVNDSVNFEVLLNEFFKRFSYVSSYCFNPHNTFEIPNSTTCYTHWLKITKSYQQKFTPDRIRNLKIAQNYGWTLTKSNDITDLISIFKQNHASKIEGNVSESAYCLLTKLHEILVQKNKVNIYYISKNQRVESGIMLINNRFDLIYIFNAATTEGRKYNARTWLINKILSQYPNYTFDFESPEIPSIATHYESFGSSAVSFKRLRYNKLPLILRVLQNIRLKIWQKIKQKI